MTELFALYDTNDDQILSLDEFEEVFCTEMLREAIIMKLSTSLEALTNMIRQL